MGVLDLSSELCFCAVCVVFPGFVSAGFECSVAFVEDHDMFLLYEFG